MGGRVAFHHGDGVMKPGREERSSISASPATPQYWSIGIYAGESPLRLQSHPEINNPVIHQGSVSDVPATFVADPFMIRSGQTWCMFFEVLNAQTDKGEIGLATSDDGLQWVYRQIVLAESYHLSYPYVFEWKGDYYMIPETLLGGAVRLYRAASFPTEWHFASNIITGTFADPSVFYWQDQWWMFVCSTPYQHDTLRLYFADELSGPWIEHPSSPIVTGDKSIARPAGRVLVSGDKVIRFAQDCRPYYGSQVRAFEITELTTTTYLESEVSESPILTGTGSGWNEARMHHVDAHLTEEGQWIACVDGYCQPISG